MYSGVEGSPRESNSINRVGMQKGRCQAGEGNEDSEHGHMAVL